MDRLLARRLLHLHYVILKRLHDLQRPARFARIMRETRRSTGERWILLVVGLLVETGQAVIASSATKRTHSWSRRYAHLLCALKNELESLPPSASRLDSANLARTLTANRTLLRALTDEGGFACDSHSLADQMGRLASAAVAVWGDTIRTPFGRRSRA